MTTSKPDRGAPALALEGVHKSFEGRPAVRALDLVVPRGSVYGLLGPNGAGKTTSIRILLGILAADGGRVEVLGEPVSRASTDRIGYLPEERGLYARMRVEAVLLYLAELKGVPRRSARPRVARWLERLDLAGRAHARVHELSKGMQQKLQFIAALLHEPEIVVLDEPFSGLDPLNQRHFREVIAELRADGRTVLFSTHIIEHAERLCDRVCILAGGRRVVEGPVAEVRRAHARGHVEVTVDGWTDGVLERLRALPPVSELRERGLHAELVLRQGADAGEVLRALAASEVTVRRFEVVDPTLEQVFLERVGAPPGNGAGAGAPAEEERR